MVHRCLFGHLISDTFPSLSLRVVVQPQVERSQRKAFFLLPGDLFLSVVVRFPLLRYLCRGRLDWRGQPQIPMLLDDLERQTALVVSLFLSGSKGRLLVLGSLM